MPPARKDPSEEDDPSRPSTSRAFSPVIPPIKRAKTSTGAVPSAPSRRQSTGGGRQSRIEDFIDEKDLQDRLLMAVTETADEIMKEEEEEGKEKIEIESEVLSLTAGIVWDALAEDWATDLLAFSRHAGRENIREDDVRLLMRRNPSLMEEIFGECEGEEGMNPMGGIKRRSTGGRISGRPQKEPREEENISLFDDVTTPQGASSMTSVVPETPQGIMPLAHSTPMNRTMSRIIGADLNFSVPSPIREEDEEMEGGKRDGRKINRSILDDLSATIREENEKKKEGGETMEMEDHDLSPLVIDLRHPREQEDEKRRMSRREEGESEQQPGPSRHRLNYSREESPELFGGEEKKVASYDSFDDDAEHENKENDDRKRREDTSHRMSESAALREMLDGEEEEKEKTMIGKDKEDSFDDNSIQFVEEKKTDDKVPRPIMIFPSPPSIPIVQKPTTSTAAAAVDDRAAPAVSTKSLSSQDSFLNDDIVDVPPQPVKIPPAAAVPIVEQQPTAAPVQSGRADDYDSFDDDDDDFVATPTPSKDSTPKAKGGPSPSNTVANRWSTVEVEEVGSQAVPQKNNGVIRGVFAEDIFGFNDALGASKKAPLNNKPSPTVPTWQPAAATVTKKPSPTVRISPSVQTKPSPLSSSVKETPSSKDGKAAGFSFFSDSPPKNTPTLQREDSDFLDTSTRQSTSATKTPRGRGGRGRGFPRKVDPNSKINRKIREQSTPVRLSPRPPLRISEVVGSFEDDDFDVSAFD